MLKPLASRIPFHLSLSAIPVEPSNAAATCILQPFSLLPLHHLSTAIRYPQSVGPRSHSHLLFKKEHNVFDEWALRDLLSNATVYSGASEESGGMSLIYRRWTTKKTAGSTKNGRDSNPKNLGVKKYGGEKVIPGNIIVRQRGTRFHPGNYIGMGKDHTLLALKEGNVRFERHKLSGRKRVHVDPKDGHVLHPVYTNAATEADSSCQLC